MKRYEIDRLHRAGHMVRRENDDIVERIVMNKPVGKREREREREQGSGV